MYEPEGYLGLQLLTWKWMRLSSKHTLEKSTQREFPCAVLIRLKYAKVLDTYHATRSALDSLVNEVATCNI